MSILATEMVLSGRFRATSTWVRALAICVVRSLLPWTDFGCLQIKLRLPISLPTVRLQGIYKLFGLIAIRDVDRVGHLKLPCNDQVFDCQAALRTRMICLALQSIAMFSVFGPKHDIVSVRCHLGYECFLPGH